MERFGENTVRFVINSGPAASAVTSDTKGRYPSANVISRIVALNASACGEAANAWEPIYKW